MKIKEAVGIDVGKLTNEARVHTTGACRAFSNSQEGYRQLLRWAHQSASCAPNQILFALEHTGIYSYPLATFLEQQGQPFVLLAGLELKRSLGIQRGKSDRVDARRIALYAYRRRDTLQPTTLPTASVAAIKRLLSLRDRLLSHRNGYGHNLKENGQFLPREGNEALFEVQEHMRREIDTQLAAVDRSLDRLVAEDPELRELAELITSVRGVGRVTALFLIAYTSAFTLFASWRKLASYAGTAPFPFQSGISVRGRTRVSHLANKRLKVVLNMCAISAVQHNAELKAYYLRRVAEGKNGMCAMNIVRNKLLARIFAVVNRRTPYVDTFKFAA